jgi:hypothetical protein
MPIWPTRGALGARGRHRARRGALHLA